MRKSLKAHYRKKQIHMSNEISFRSSNALESHKKIHTIHKPLHSCTKCSKKFNEDSSVGDIENTHISSDKEISIVSEGQNSIITVKGKQNNNHPANIMEHKKISTATVPTGALPVPVVPYKGQIYNCNSCSKRFISSEGLERHKRMQHSGKSLYICKKCNEQFNTFQRLKKHYRRTHTKWGEEMITLSINKVSNIRNGVSHSYDQSCHDETKAQNEMPILSENEINNHLKDIMEHQKNKSTVPYSEVFSSQLELRPYERRKTFKYFCNSCSRSFKNIHDLQRHKRIQHMDKSCNVCATCNKQFDTFELVKKHFLHTHRQREQEDLSDDDVECIDTNKDIETPSDECRNIHNITRIKNLKKKITKNFKRMIARQRNTTVHPANTRSRVKADIRKLNAVTPNLAIQSSAIPERGFVVVSVPDAKVSTQNTKATFHVIKTKPNVEACALNTQDSLPCRLLTKEVVNNAKTITEDSNALILATPDRSPTKKPKVLSIPVVRHTSATVLYNKPAMTNRQSKVPYSIPDLTTAKENIMVDADLKNTMAIVENAQPDIKKTTSNVAYTALIIPNLINTNMDNTDGHEMVTREHQEEYLLVDGSDVHNKSGRCKRSCCKDISRCIEKNVCKYCGKGFVNRYQLKKHMITHNKWQIPKIRDFTDTSSIKIPDDDYSKEKETNDNFVLKNDVYSSDEDIGEIMDDYYIEEANDRITDATFVNGNYSENEGESAIESEEIRDINTFGVIDEVCLDLVEESLYINAQLDPLSGSNDDKELLQRNIEPMLVPSLIPEQIIKIKEENVELISDQTIIIEEEITQPIPARRVKREESIHISPDEILNIKYECIEPSLIIPNIKDENIESVPAMAVKREAIIPVLPEQIMNT